MIIRDYLLLIHFKMTNLESIANICQTMTLLFQDFFKSIIS